MDGLAHYIVEMYSQDPEGPSSLDARVQNVSSFVPFSEDIFAYCIFFWPDARYTVGCRSPVGWQKGQK